MSYGLHKKFCSCLLYDIFVHRRSHNEHLNNLKQVLLVLSNNHLFANSGKCTFCVNMVIFLVFVVNKNGVHVDP